MTFPRVCFLSGRAGIEEREEAFRQGLRELGYLDGQNIIIEWRFAKVDTSRLPALAQELVQSKCDVIVAGGTEATNAFKSATATIPVVFTVASDPVGAGLVTSLDRPGMNVTGLSLDAPRVGRQTARYSQRNFASPKAQRGALSSRVASLQVASEGNRTKRAFT